MADTTRGGGPEEVVDSARRGDIRAMPPIGLGTWELRCRPAYEAGRRALDVGYRHIDTATVYDNELEVGRALHDSGVSRDSVFVTTKLPPDRVGQERQALDDSLRLLGLDYVDLWLVHHPPNGTADVGCWRAMIELQRTSKAVQIGVSNHSLEQVVQLIVATGVTPAVNQIRWGTTLFNERMLTETLACGIVLEGYHPFKASALDDPVLVSIAETHDVTTAQVVLRWHVEHGVPTIPKSARPERIAENLDVFDFALTSDEIKRIDATSLVASLPPGT